MTSAAERASYCWYSKPRRSSDATVSFLLISAAVDSCCCGALLSSRVPSGPAAATAPEKAVVVKIGLRRADPRKSRPRARRRQGHAVRGTRQTDSWDASDPPSNEV